MPIDAGRLFKTRVMFARLKPGTAHKKFKKRKRPGAKRPKEKPGKRPGMTSYPKMLKNSLYHAYI